MVSTVRDPRGSWWRKWDLHVHTPASVVPTGFGGDSPSAWTKYFEALRALPDTIKVLGINDYIFVDGYTKVREEWEAGHLPNIELVLPVVELRVDKFGGTANKLSRVNVHVIFSNEVAAHEIEQQFLTGLKASYSLNPAHGDVTWSAVPTRASLTDLGRKVIESVPQERRSQFAAPLIEGFNNFNVSLDSVIETLESPYFENKFLLAVGKTEWSDIKWSDGSIAEKKSIINRADLVFTAADKPEQALQGRRSLEAAGVNPRLLDCSDAHHFADSTNKDRLGNCHTWIKGDPTFDGLKHALTEFNDRTFIGERPDTLTRLIAAPTKILRGVEIRRKQEPGFSEPWFDGTVLQFNPGLIAIIGNKGSGKSALLDIIGVLGDTDRQSSASFLSSSRFRRHGENKASHFEARLSWVGGPTEWRSIDADVPAGTPARVAYIPQNLFETICNELVTTERGQFDLELKRVIFSHVEAPDRLGRATLDELLSYRSEQLRSSATERRSRLSEVNRQIVDLEGQLEEPYRRNLEAELSRVRGELEVLKANEPLQVAQPEETPTVETESALKRLGELRDGAQRLRAEVDIAHRQLGRAVEQLAAFERVNERLRRLDREMASARADLASDLEMLGVGVDDVISVSINRDAIESARQTANIVQSTSQKALSDSDPQSLTARLAAVDEAIAAEETALDEPNRLYQDYLERMDAWKRQVSELEGNAEAVGSMSFFENRLDALREIPGRLESLRKNRQAISREIFETIAAEASVLRKLYRPVQDFIDSNELAKRTMKLSFSASIQDAGFAERFLDRIHQGRVGSFAGKEEGEHRVRDLLLEADLSTVDGALSFAETILGLLAFDVRDPKRPHLRSQDQIRGSHTLGEMYDFLFGFEYLEARYGLLFGGRPLHELSPGEKGSLLLVFYLLVDRGDVPLLIDQPEENLDNETVYSLLVPSIREAKNRRQVVIVTHNPNLAVVCDADQVIYARRQSSPVPRIEYESGGIENPHINKRLLDVLEGTRPAFDNRSEKYMGVEPT